jgi:hypothetical protein
MQVRVVQVFGCMLTSSLVREVTNRYGVPRFQSFVSGQITIVLPGNYWSNRLEGDKGFFDYLVQKGVIERYSHRLCDEYPEVQA